MIYNGMKIITNPNLVVPGPPVTRRRTWKERLFSRPWRPWKTMVTEATWVPDRKIYHGMGALIVHPAVAEELRRFLDDHEL